MRGPLKESISFFSHKVKPFGTKQPVCLGELPLPQMAFSINSHAGEGFWGFRKFGEEGKR